MIEHLATIYNWIQKKLGGELIPSMKDYVNGENIPLASSTPENVSGAIEAPTESIIVRDKTMVDYTDVLGLLIKDVNDTKSQIIDRSREIAILNANIAELTAVITNIQSLNPPQIVPDDSQPPLSE